MSGAELRSGLEVREQSLSNIRDALAAIQSVPAPALDAVKHDSVTEVDDRLRALERSLTIEELSVENEPTFVGVHSGIVNETCQVWSGDSPGDIERCTEPATHTVIEYSGRIHEIAVCDEHGEPDDLPTNEREWSGR